MEISRAKFRQIVNLSVLHRLILILGSFVFLSFEAKADGYAECNQILVQDIFNKISSSDSKSSHTKAEAREAFFSMSDTEAYNEYLKKHRETSKDSKDISGEGHYAFIGGEFAVKLNQENELSGEDFRKSFLNARGENSGSSSSASSSTQNLVNKYASYVRDSGTVDAWKECVTKTKETNLYAFASRDNAGEIYVNVIWVPGVLAGSLPSIPVKFVTDGDADGVKIHADPEEQIAMGSGQSFAVTCGAKCDNGFQVTVNGTLKNAAGIKTNSFSSTVEVPQCSQPIRT